MLATLVTFQVASAGSTKEYDYWKVPHPQVNLEECNLSDPGWICDPGHTLSREQADHIAELLGGSATEAPFLSLVIFNDDGAENFGLLQNFACQLKRTWSKQVNFFSNNDSEMQMLLKKGAKILRCGDGSDERLQDIIHAFSVAKTPEDMITALDALLPQIKHRVLAFRERERERRWWHSMESCATSVSLLLTTLYIFYLRSPARRQKAILDI